MYLAALLAFLGLLAATLGLWWWRVRPRPVPGGRREVSAVPGYTVAERVALDGVTTEAVRLAVHMARVDEHVDDTELDAIRGFITSRMLASDRELAERVMHKALERPLAPSDLQLSISTIHAIGSHRQLRITVGLLARVAQADGEVDPREKAFVEQVAAGLGIQSEELEAILSGRLAES